MLYLYKILINNIKILYKFCYSLTALDKSSKNIFTKPTVYAATTTTGRSTTPSIPSAFTFGNT